MNWGEKSRGTEKLCSLDLGNRIHALPTTDSPNLLCEKIQTYRRTLYLFPIRNLQAIFNSDGADNELRIMSTSIVPHIECKGFVGWSFFQNVSVTDVVFNLLV